jgi:SAM-dependent methyltransferase
MPFRRDFDCLWCGRPWEVRSDDDLEGWTALCPECLGKADDNGFLRSRLRAGLRERAAVASAASPAAIETTLATHDDWYLRQGRFSRGPVYDEPWSMELDEATRWLDAVPMSGVIVELGCGSGWWSALLAGKGELWLYDADGAALDAARKRLMAHGLLAHLHQRDPLAAADKSVDVVFGAYLLGGAATDAQLDARVAAARTWLKPGGSFAFIEAQSAQTSGPIDGPAGPLWPRDISTLRERLLAGGWDAVEISRTSSAFVLGRAEVAA